ncbi:MAG: response regulator [Nitrospira sp.]
MKRVLLVEDNLGDARLAQEMLSESPDFEVDVTCVGRLNQAVDVMTNESFDVVLLDLSLPDSDKLEGLQRLQPLSKEAPIIVLTGLNDKAQALEALKHGAQDYLLKGTMNSEALVRVIQYSIERRASDARYRSLVANIPGVVYRCHSDKRGALLFASPSFETLTGYSIEEFMAKASGGYSDLIHSDDRERTMCMLLGAVTRKQPYSIEYRIRRKDGQIRWIFDRGQGVGPARGALPNRDGVLFDITEQHAMEEKFSKADQQLRQAEQFAAMGNLACGVAHDFNNLITAINGFADLVVHDLPADTRAHGRMLQIRKAGQRAMAITQHLLSLGKTTTKDPVLLDMNLLLADMERMIRLVIGVRREVTIVSDPFLGRVRGNPRELEQALLILAMNIIQGHGEDVHLQIETRTWNIDGKDAEAMGFICRGPFTAVIIRAVSPEYPAPVNAAPQCLVFPENEAVGEDEERFGMAAVLKTITEHQGYCFVSQDDMEVSEYTLVFPVSHIAQGVMTFNHTAESPRRSGSETVLVVDDEDTVRTLIRELLEANGYRVLDACDGSQALRMSEQHEDKIDLLIVDEVMPGLSGHELTAQMAEAHPHLCTLPMSTVKPQFMVGEKPFLMKPFTEDILLKRVGEALQDGPIGHAAALQS